MPHVVFVNRYFHPDHSATSQLLGDLAFHLAAQGFDVDVLTSGQIYDDPGALLSRHESIRGVDVRRLGATRFGRSRLAGRALDYLSFHGSVALALRRIVRGDTIVVALTDPPLAGVTAAFAIAGRSAKLVNWVQDLFPEVAEELGVLKRTGWIANRFRALRDSSLRKAALNIALSDGMRQAIEERGANAAVAHNWSDASAIAPVEPRRNALRELWGLGSRFVVGYSGNLGRAHEFDTLAGAMARVRNPTIRLVVIGGGPRQQELEAELRRRGISDRAEFHGYQPRENLSESLGVADVHLVSLRPGLERYIVPSKFYGITAAGRPTIWVGNPDSDIPRLIRDASCGLTVRAGDSEGLADAIERLRADEALRESMGRNARRLFEDRFASTVALARWEALLRGLSE